MFNVTERISEAVWVSNRLKLHQLRMRVSTGHRLRMRVSTGHRLRMRVSTGHRLGMRISTSHSLRMRNTTGHSGEGGDGSKGHGGEDGEGETQGLLHGNSPFFWRKCAQDEPKLMRCTRVREYMVEFETKLKILAKQGQRSAKQKRNRVPILNFCGCRSCKPRQPIPYAQLHSVAASGQKVPSNGERSSSQKAKFKANLTKI
jgi:hypothetical protein